MKKDFYNNPLRLLWRGKRSLMPTYLWVIWIVILLFELVMIKYFRHVINFSAFTFEKFFTPSLTGLTFTLALFVAEKNVFRRDELKELAKYQGNKKCKGWALDELLSPFMFTSILFLLTGTISLLGQFIYWRICNDKLIDIIFITVYVDILLLALFGLFGLIVVTLNDTYLSSKR
ncbi:hypothetical protein ABB44_05945 [Companilactobacillus farciminis]|jgi:hypothetical protein|uniref:hypothetical protein n=1 Tax=Companilactobacillus pabuli TaxID=2714036 RepID=UPI00065B1C03|nr:hypothetical protein ABB45_05935 [Companilactobacillus farciminis]AKS51509.1 hypothetical protein ABB44_05945 [Companilactobacillus farciminis]